MEIDINEYFELSRALEIYHAVFYKFWELGKPVFTDAVPTCGVRFNSKGEYFEFNFNPEFWKTLKTVQEKCFIICHECLHVILEHGKRAVDVKPERRPIANIAMDLAINQLLESGFGFIRKNLPIAETGCWLDTCVKDKDLKQISPNQSFEYYYNFLMSNKTFVNIKPKSSLDSHTGLPTEGDISELLKEIGKGLTEEEKKDFIEKAKNDTSKKKRKPYDDVDKGNGRGTGSLGEVFTLANEPVSKKKVWKSLIKKLDKKWNADKDDEQWARINRRFSCIDSKIFIPTEYEQEEKEKNKVEVWLYMDCSGSCESYKQYFLNMIRSIPEEYFEIKAYSFDTVVHNVDLKLGKVRGGGGTSFDILENHVLNHTVAKGLKYPEAVFVLTDGHGNEVKPKYPERWYWFLHGGKNSDCFPKTCKKYNLEDIEIGKLVTQ